MRVPFGPIRVLTRRRILFLALAWGSFSSSLAYLWELLAGPDGKGAVSLLASNVLSAALAYFVARAATNRQALSRTALWTAVAGVGAVGSAWRSAGSQSVFEVGLQGVAILALAFATFTIWSYVLVRYSLQAKSSESGEAQDRLIIASSAWIVVPLVLRILQFSGLGGDAQTVARLIELVVESLTVVAASGFAVHRLRARRRWLRSLAAGDDVRWRVVPLEELAEAEREHLPVIAADGESSDVLVYLDDEPGEPYRETRRRRAVALVPK